MLMFNPLQSLLTPNSTGTPNDVFSQMSSYMNSPHAHAALAALASSVPSLTRPVPNSQTSPTTPISTAQQTSPLLSSSMGAQHLQTHSLTSSQQQQQQYCLKWNNHTNNLVKVFTDLLSDENLCDMTLSCDGKNLKAHKLILAACSDYFRDVFLNNPCQHPVIIIKDVRHDDLRAIIHYMYTGEVNVSHAQMSTLLTTAETLKVKGLLEVNEKHQNGSSATTTTAATATVNGAGVGSDSSNPYLTPTFGDDNTPQSPVLNGYFSAFNKAKQNAKRKRSFVSSVQNSNGSAFALANMLGKGGNLAFAAAAAAALAQENGLKNGASFAAALQKFSNSSVSNGTFEDELESGDEINSNSHKRRAHELGKDSASDDSHVNSDHDPPHTESVTNGAQKEMIAMALTLAANRAKKPGSVHDDDEPEDDGAEESDGKFMNDDHHDGMESDDEFYSDLKPIVSLDESPSPTNSALEESAFNPAFMSSGILENSLNGLPMNQMPNGKVCVCHLCNLTFTAYSSLRRHMARHIADRERYECDICRKSYSRKDYLKEYKKLKHSDVPKLISPTENTAM